MIRDKIICAHEYVLLNERRYRDYCGYRVKEVIYLCKKCGKKKVKRYW